MTYFSKVYILFFKKIKVDCVVIFAPSLSYYKKSWLKNKLVAKPKKSELCTKWLSLLVLRKDSGRRRHGRQALNHRSPCKTPKSLKFSAHQNLAPTFPKNHLSVHRRTAGVCGSDSLHILTRFCFFFHFPPTCIWKHPGSSLVPRGLLT